MGLVNRDEACLEHPEALESLRGKWLSVSGQSLERIKNKRDLRTLKDDVEKNATYYDWDGYYDVYAVYFDEVQNIIDAADFILFFFSFTLA